MIESILNKQEESNKAKNKKGKQKSYSGNRKIYPWQRHQKSCPQSHIQWIEDFFHVTRGVD
jgi:hypothetical protein